MWNLSYNTNKHIYEIETGIYIYIYIHIYICVCVCVYIYIYIERERERERENRFVVPKLGWRGRREGLGVWDLEIQTVIQKVDKK